MVLEDTSPLVRIPSGEFIHEQEALDQVVYILLFIFTRVQVRKLYSGDDDAD